jgi:transcriptional regulator with GAF, ATPase, and Fis domain
MADGGTLFLDELGELPETLQAHLLRVLDSGGEYQRLGEDAIRTSAFGFVGATNRDPSSLKGDLAGRLSARLSIPPLRERRADIPLLCCELLAREARAGRDSILHFCENGDPRRPRLEPLLAEALVLHDHRLNTRGLLQLLLLSAQSSPGDHLRLTPAVQDALGHRAPEAAPVKRLKSDKDRALRRQVEHALASSDTLKGAAERLGMTRFQLNRAMERLGIEKPGRP